jgi:hypothetical protein
LHSQVAQRETADWPMMQTVGHRQAKARLLAQSMGLYSEADDIAEDVSGVDRPTRRFDVDLLLGQLGLPEADAEGCYRSKGVERVLDLAGLLTLGD